MRIFGLVIMSAKRYDEHNAAVDRESEELKVKIGALEFDNAAWKKRFFEKKREVYDLRTMLKDAEIKIEQLNEMNDGLWEMKGVAVDEDRIDR